MLVDFDSKSRFSDKKTFGSDNFFCRNFSVGLIFVSLIFLVGFLFLKSFFKPIRIDRSTMIEEEFHRNSEKKIRQKSSKNFSPRKKVEQIFFSFFFVSIFFLFVFRRKRFAVRNQILQWLKSRLSFRTKKFVERRKKFYSIFIFILINEERSKTEIDGTK